MRKIFVPAGAFKASFGLLAQDFSQGRLVSSRTRATNVTRDIAPRDT